VNVELGFDKYVNWKPRATRDWLHVDLYGFGDAGVMELSNFNYSGYFLANVAAAQPAAGYLSTLHTDAGIGAAFTIKKWGVFDRVRPITLRIDLPLFLNRPPFSNTDYSTVRYIVGINRAF
jgi:aminopeptidase N